MPVPFATVAELVAALERSDLPNLITEGKTDYGLVRHLAAASGGDCLPAGNKLAVLAVCDAGSPAALHRTALLVDSDLWLFDGVPAKYDGLEHLVITEGYSIENDLLRDADVESLIDDHEMDRYLLELRNVCDWFSAGVTARRAGLPFDFEIGISRVLNADGSLTALALKHLATYQAPTALRTMIRDEYPKYLRGKTWLSVLNRVLCAQGRPIAHPPMSLLAVGMRSQKEYSRRIRDGVAARF